MKKFYTAVLTAVLIAGSFITASAQQVFSINTNTSWTNSIKQQFPNNFCNGCIVEIAEGVTLTLDADLDFSGTTFTGGTIVLNKKMTLQPGNVTSFQNTNIVLNSSGEITSNGQLAIEGSTITLQGNAKMTLNSSTSIDSTVVTINNKAQIISNSQLALNNSQVHSNADAKITLNAPSDIEGTQFNFEGKASLRNNSTLNVKTSLMKFTGNSYFDNRSIVDLTGTTVDLSDNAYFESSSIVNLRGNSIVKIGDGSFESKSYFYMNASLNIYDNSMVHIANKNNYYGSWSLVYLRSLGTTFKPYQTAWNQMNCGAEGPNPCKQNFIYGPLGITANGPQASSLPVKLSSFEVKAAGSVINLNWATQQEQNSARFVILRSTDNKNWNEIGEVQAAGNSTVKIEYSFTDYSTTAAQFFYRLKIVDLDGSVEYSEIRQVNLAGTSKVSVFPNPATEFIQVSTGTNGKGAKVQLISVTGLTLEERTVTDSGAVTTLQVGKYSNGMYIIRVIHQSGTVESFRVLVNNK